MDFILNSMKDFVGNYLLVSAIIAWITAQIIKIFTGAYKDRHVNLFVILHSTGGMPSSHSATMLAVTTAAALQEGFASPVFAVSAIISIIVLTDATGVRYETGKQSKMLNEIVQELFTDTEKAEVHFKEFIGHTPMQVVVGSTLGVVIAIAMYFVYH